MAITDESTLIAAAKGVTGARLFVKASAVSGGTGTFHSTWKLAGQPVAGANPPLFSNAATKIPTKATVGSFPFVNGAVDGDRALIKVSPVMATAGMFIPYDRLWSCSGFGTVVTTAQAVNTPESLPSARDPNLGADVLPFLEVYTAPGATTATWTITGTDANGNTGRTWVYTHPANAESIGQMMLALPGGASPATTAGIRQVTQFTCSASSGTAGDVGITLARIMSPAGSPITGQGPVLDALLTGLPTVYNDSCISAMVLCSTTNTGLILGEMVIG